MQHLVPAIGADALAIWPGGFGSSHEPRPTASTATTPTTSTLPLSSTHVSLLLCPLLAQLAQPTAHFFQLLPEHLGFVAQPARFVPFVLALGRQMPVLSALFAWSSIAANKPNL